MFLVLDTETTGVTASARLVQLAWRLYDRDRELVDADTSLIAPVGFVIPPEATAVHGITTEKARADGVRLVWALERLQDAAISAHILVAHNLAFDVRVLEYESRRLGRYPHVLLLKRIDTMRATTQFCAIESPNLLRGYKWPKLIELHHKLFETDFEAHDAGADADACARCLWALIDRGVIALPQGSQG
jgi:DNA polymerase III epsilon subunit-like protein